MIARRRVVNPTDTGGPTQSDEGTAQKPPILLFGASGHAKVIADIIEKAGACRVAGFADDRYMQPDGQFFGYPIIGGRQDVLAWRDRFGPVRIIVSIGANCIRESITQWFAERDFEFATAIHPSAQIARDVRIGAGTVIMARVAVNPGSVLGPGCIVNTCASVDHDCRLGGFVHLAPGARLCGGVAMDDRSMLGSGGVVIPNVHVGADVMIGAGAVVVSEAVVGRTYVGVPARPKGEHEPRIEAPPSPPVHWRTSPSELNILFTCVGRRNELVDAFRGAMRKLGLRGKLYASDVSPFQSAVEAADAYLPMPHVEDSGYMPAMLEAVDRLKIGLVIPLTDLDLVDLARQRDRFRGVGCEVMVGSEQIVTFCRDKLQLPGLLDSLGLPSARAMDLSEFRRSPFFPAFVKPLHGSGSVGAARVDTMDALDVHVRLHGGRMLVQTYVPGREYTVDVYKSRDGQTRCIVPRQRLRVRGGEVEHGVTVKDEAIIEATRTLSDGLKDIWGVFCCQCRRGPDGRIYFFEVNPRFGGGCPLSVAAGADMPACILQDLLGLEIETDGAFTDRLLMMRYPAAIYRQVDRLEDLPGFDKPIFR